MNHNQIVKEQLLHMLFGTGVFLVLAALAVGLDLAAAKLTDIGVSEFTKNCLMNTAHGMLLLDIGLLVVYLVVYSVKLVKEMVK